MRLLFGWSDPKVQERRDVLTWLLGTAASLLCLQWPTSQVAAKQVLHASDSLVPEGWEVVSQHWSEDMYRRELNVVVKLKRKDVIKAETLLS